MIGIIALLISILLPALNKARAQATTVQCLSNLRQIGQAVVMYANDNKGFLVPQDYSNSMNNWACILVGAGYLPNDNTPNATDGIVTKSALWYPASVDLIERYEIGNSGSLGVPTGYPFGSPVTGGWSTAAGPVSFQDHLGAGVFRCQSTLNPTATQAWSWCDTSYGINGISPTSNAVLGQLPTFPAISWQVLPSVGAAPPRTPSLPPR